MTEKTLIVKILTVNLLVTLRFCLMLHIRHPIQVSQPPSEVGIIIFALQLRKLRPREVTGLS